jgi:HlyD family secretion protein
MSTTVEFLRKNRWLTVAAIILLAAVGSYLIIDSDGDEVSYRTGVLSRGDVVLSISATGTVNPVTTVQVGSQVSGTIAHLYADFNDVVKEGQLLAQLDPTFLQASVNEQRANVSRARAQVNEAERNFTRTSDLFAKDLVSQAEMDVATTGVESARATLLQAEASLDRAEVNLRFATIRSPIKGVVISRNVDVGQTVAASLQAPTLFSIAKDLRKMQVEATVDEADIGNVKTGQLVTFRVDAHPDDAFEGNIVQVRLGPTLNQNVVTYTVIIEVSNPELKLMPGMTATVTIEVSRKDDVIRAPLQAVRFRPPVEESNNADTPAGRGSNGSEGRPDGKERGGPKRGSHLWVLREGKLVAIPARFGLQDLQFAEVLETGLKEGDEVVTGIELTQPPTSQAPQNPFQPQMPTSRRRGGM